jgi:hypothetical protein
VWLLDDGDHTLRGLGVAEAARDPVVDEHDRHVATCGGTEQVGLTAGGRGGHEQLPDDVRRRVEDVGDRVRSLDEKRAGGRPLPAAQELSGGRDARVVRRRDRGQAAVSEPVAGKAARAVSTSAANAAASETASSARFLRSTSTLAAFRPWMNRL